MWRMVSVTFPQCQGFEKRYLVVPNHQDTQPQSFTQNQPRPAATCRDGARARRAGASTAGERGLSRWNQMKAEIDADKSPAHTRPICQFVLLLRLGFALRFV